MKVSDIPNSASIEWLQKQVVIIDNITNECLLNNQNDHKHLLIPIKLIDGSYILCSDFLLHINKNDIYYNVYESCKNFLVNCEVINMADIEHLVYADAL